MARTPFDQDALVEDPAKGRLMNLLRQLCDRYEWNSGGRPRIPAVLAMLLEGTCERSITYRFANPNAKDPTRFDALYSAKSLTATSFVIMATVKALEEAGHHAGVATEAKDLLGSYDVVVVKGSPNLVLRKGVPLVRVEIKGSWGIPLLPQITRYAFSPTPLVIARVMTNQVVVLEPMKLKGFVDFAMEQLASRARRILENSPTVVPGIDCRACGDRGCPYNEQIQRPGRRLIAMQERELEEDLNLFYTNLPRVCQRVADEVVRRVGEVPSA